MNVQRKITVTMDEVKTIMEAHIALKYSADINQVELRWEDGDDDEIEVDDQFAVITVDEVEKTDKVEPITGYGWGTTP